MGLTDFMPLVTQLGVPITLVLFFVWETKEREKRMTARLDKVDDMVIGKLSEMSEASTRAITQNTEVIAENTEVMERLESYLERSERSDSKIVTSQEIPRRRDGA